MLLNFDPTLHNLRSPNCHGIEIYVSNMINATELSFDTQFKEHLWVSIPLLNNDSLSIGCMFLNFDLTLHNLRSSNCRSIAIYVSNMINATELSFYTQFKEYLWVSLNNDSLSIGCIYRSLTADLVTSTKSLCDLHRVATESCSHLLICCDFNYANINWANNIGHTGDSYAQQVISKLNDVFLYLATC